MISCSFLRELVKCTHLLYHFSFEDTLNHALDFIFVLLEGLATPSFLQVSTKAEKS